MRVAGTVAAEVAEAVDAEPMPPVTCDASALVQAVALRSATMVRLLPLTVATDLPRPTVDMVTLTAVAAAAAAAAMATHLALPDPPPGGKSIVIS